MTRQTSARLAGWLDNNRVGVLLLSVVVALLGGYLAARMPIKSDLTNLLPSSKSSVQSLQAVQKRARPFGTVQIVIECPTREQCLRANDELSARIGKFPAGMVAAFTRDDGAKHRYAWQHRFLFADYQDLVDARDALAERIHDARLGANPLFIDLDDDAAKPDPDKDRMAELEEKLADLEARAKHPPLRASADGRFHLLTIQTTFGPSDTPKARALIGLVETAVAEVGALDPAVQLGLTGNITLAMHEHDSVLSGMTLALVITVLLVGLALVLYYRSGWIVLAMLWALAVGVLATFAVAWAAIGHLNVMTAFLFAIVVGNGINASLVFVARYNEAVREHSQRPIGATTQHGDRTVARDVLAGAMRGAIPGTLGAAATAAIAYTSLLVSDFRGFFEFGAIAALGMAVTWLTTFTVLPATLFVLARRGEIKKSRPPAVGDWLVRLLPRRALGWGLVVASLVTAGSLAITAQFIANDPFTDDWRDLQSSTPAIERALGLYGKMRQRLEQRSEVAGAAYQLVIAVEKREQVAPLVAYLKKVDADRPPEQRWVRDVYSLEDLLPSRQPEKLAVLEQIRTLIDDPKLQQTLTDEEKAKLAKLRPPAELRPLRDDEVPSDLAWPFIERDGSLGRIVLLRGASRLNSFDVSDRLEFAAEARKLELPPGAVAAAESLIVADIIETMEHDAPRMIIFAVLGSILAVFLVIGLGRHGLVTIACGMAGVVVMIAACALAGLSVHFLDLIALPITVGIGIDYAVNLAARERQEGEKGPHHLLRTTGGTVLLCSFTTAVGYGTLLLSANGGIRAFGLAALLGEIACIGIALLVAPAWLAWLRDRRSRAA